ncbi:hypothetical protein SS50377_25253 [Spironucleus salmonicida]|uniref:Uncharacterized protein n=1 Tax=Spironucleus salmonicida TaxID=348837 RepID=V6LDV0_9EUKA|nr:hypothetical protein SS50377_25253 [Spironucleus salmonicida]|eukprot:EST41866.1 Hypothetical protein SS50377_18702 [Spironucleus salmonicida]
MSKNLKLSIDLSKILISLNAGDKPDKKILTNVHSELQRLIEESSSDGDFLGNFSQKLDLPRSSNIRPDKLSSLTLSRVPDLLLLSKSNINPK